MPHRSTTPEAIRLDKWLWAARFFKTRQLASEAARGGKVTVNGQRAKPARPIAVGDRLEIQLGPYTWDVRVDGLAARRGPAAAAAKLYTESEHSAAARTRTARERRTLAAQIIYDRERPAPRNQRAMRRLKRQQ